LGLPWRSAAGSASNTTDMQAATETAMGLWGALMAEATLVVHAAGWLEGGLTFGFEKFVADCVALETLAELARTPESDPEAFDAIAAVPPAGHFFGAAHTMARYRSAFHPPLLSDFRPFGTWAEDGAVPSEARATALWQARIADAPPPAHGGDAAERLAPWIERRRAAGGMEPAGT
ncbi:MAG: trimethylamine methyltransferase family protein, partial [Pseudomonadota bacterium]